MLQLWREIIFVQTVAVPVRQVVDRYLLLDRFLFLIVWLEVDWLILELGPLLFQKIMVAHSFLLSLLLGAILKFRVFPSDRFLLFSFSLLWLFLIPLMVLLILRMIYFFLWIIFLILALGIDDQFLLSSANFPKQIEWSIIILLHCHYFFFPFLYARWHERTSLPFWSLGML